MGIVILYSSNVKIDNMSLYIFAIDGNVIRNSVLGGTVK